MLPIVTKCKVIAFRRSPKKVKQRRNSFCRVVSFEYRTPADTDITGSIERAARTLMAPELRDIHNTTRQVDEQATTASLFSEFGSFVKEQREAGKSANFSFL